jgi:hypothetical protein
MVDANTQCPFYHFPEYGSCEVNFVTYKVCFCQDFEPHFHPAITFSFFNKGLCGALNSWWMKAAYAPIFWDTIKWTYIYL